MHGKESFYIFGQWNGIIDDILVDEKQEKPQHDKYNVAPLVSDEESDDGIENVVFKQYKSEPKPAFWMETKLWKYWFSVNE